MSAGKDLKPSDELRGVWRRGDAMTGPATYAFVVGISHYEHLDGKPGHLGLDSLHSSALTAYDFFRYLADDYRLDGSPLGEIVLLLSPTKVEQSIFDQSGDITINESTAPVPTLEELRKQLQAWHARLREINPDDASESRLIFFFSGHGLEIDSKRQLLLPADYQGTTNTYNNAIMTANIHDGLACVAVPTQHFFIDACRSDVVSLHSLANLTGTPVFVTDRDRRIHRTAPIIYATSFGGDAWQPSDPQSENDISYFGKALLDALRVNPEAGFQPDCSTNPCKINVSPLLDHITEKLTAELYRRKIIRPYPVVGDCVVNTTISHWEANGVAAREDQSHAIAEEKSDLSDGSYPGRLAKLKQIEEDRVRKESVDKVLRLSSAMVGSKERRINLEYDSLAEITGSSIAKMLSELRVFSWGQRWQASHERIDISLIEQSESRGRIVVHYSFKDPKAWYWIDGPGMPLSFGFLHPASTSEHPEFALEFTLLLDASGKASDTIADVLFGLSSSSRNSQSLRAAAEAWSAYRLRSTFGGVEAIDRLVEDDTYQRSLESAEYLFDRKERSPLAATIAALILLQTDRRRHLRAWYERLAMVVGETSDAAVFCLELMWLEDDFDQLNALRYLDRIASLGTPCTSEGCSYLLAFIRRYVEGPHGRFDREGLREAQSLVQQILGSNVDELSSPLGNLRKALRSGGLFTTLAAPDDEMINLRSYLY